MDIKAGQVYKFDSSILLNMEFPDGTMPTTIYIHTLPDETPLTAACYKQAVKETGRSMIERDCRILRSDIKKLKLLFDFGTQQTNNISCFIQRRQYGG
jgi:hypothetical protein